MSEIDKVSGRYWVGTTRDGVYYCNETDKFNAAIKNEYGITHLGEYASMLDASDRYDSYIKDNGLKRIVNKEKE